MLRPHGHIMRSGDHLVPDEASLTSTAWMAGVFHSMVTQGHVSINRLLSTTRSYLGPASARTGSASSSSWTAAGSCSTSRRPSR
mgnify:CR=1 FL=1